MENFLTISRILEIAGFVLGLLYLWWEYHVDRRMWIAGLLMPAISMFVYFSKGLYADFAMNIYYLAMGVYGFTAWGRRSTADKKKKGLPVSSMNLRQTLVCVAAFVPVYIFLALWLIYGTDSNVPYADAFTTAGSIIGTWMLARKYLQQWFVWIAVDVVCTVLYIYKGIYFYSFLYAAYTVVAVFGYLKWKQVMNGESAMENN